MSLLRLENVELAFGHHKLLDQVSANLHAGDRIGLLGRNGTGKSSLLKLLAGYQLPDSGNVWRTPALRIAELSQALPDTCEQTVYDYVAGGLSGAGELLSRYHTLINHELDDKALQELQEVQTALEAVDGWSLQQRVDTIMQRLALPDETTLASLSGGWRRRAALARALVQAPDILLLDEPTNHLDINTILWLEQEIAQFRGAVLLITHDRAFLQRIANKIWELDRGQLYQCKGDYRSFLDYREQRLASEEKTNSEFDKKLADEERWIRTGVKARRTRNEGRVRALKALREQRAARREVVGTATMALDQAASSGKLVAELERVAYSIGGREIIKPFSTSIVRGDRVALIGANGSGKSTLLKLILGELEPTSGEIKRGTKLQTAYFDQLRSSLDLQANAMDNVAGGREFIEINGKNVHAISYLNNFLFESARLRTPVAQLSGGEQNRLILAKLFSQPTNLLVLDEPTNDLDLETLELLEDLLTEFDGTVLLVSHDRSFVDNVVTSTLVFDGAGNIAEYVGGYSDWQRQSAAAAPTAPVKKTPAASTKADTTTKSVPLKSGKLSYQQQRELDALPAQIETLEEEISLLNAQAQSADFFKQARENSEKSLNELAKKEALLKKHYAQWEALERLRA